MPAKHSRRKRCKKRRVRSYSGRSLKDLRSGTAGHVYVTGILEGCYKIGCSVKPETRMDRWMLLPVELFVVASIASEDAYWLERVLHTHFSTKRVRGEWFRLNNEDLNMLQAFKRIDGPGELPRNIIPPQSRCTQDAWSLTRAEQVIVNKATRKGFDYVQAFRQTVQTMLAKYPAEGFPKPLLVFAKERAVALARKKLGA